MATPLYLDDIVIVRRTMDHPASALDPFEGAMRQLVSHRSSDGDMPTLFETLCEMYLEQVSDFEASPATEDL